MGISAVLRQSNEELKKSQQRKGAAMEIIVIKLEITGFMFR